MEFKAQHGNLPGACQNRSSLDQEVLVPNRVFVGGLNETMNEEHLRQIFGVYGQIVEVLIKERGSSGGTRGFGFVTYKTKAEAQECLSQAQGEVLELCGQKLNVRQATRRPPKSSNARPKDQQPLKDQQPPILPLMNPVPPGMVAPWNIPYGFPMQFPFVFYDQHYNNPGTPSFHY